MNTQTNRGRGRPKGENKVNWSLANLLWRNRTNKEIALKMGVTVAAVYRKRKLMLADGKHVECARPKFSRAKVGTAASGTSNP